MLRTKKGHAKRRGLVKAISRKDNEGEGEALSFTLQRGKHPLGIQPLGNLFLCSESGLNLRDTGLGNLSVLSDSIVLDILSLLSAKDLCHLMAVSKGLYIFSHHEDLWRALTLQELGGSFTFNKSWKYTYCYSLHCTVPGPVAPAIKLGHFFSDLLFQSWLCARLEMKGQWLQRDNIPRRHNISVQDFVRNFEAPGRPVIITGALDNWPAMSRWSRDYLLKAAGSQQFAVGPVDMMLKDYFAYADAACEERPLYLFDPRFAEKAPQLAEDFTVPPYFAEDLFSILGDKRPDYRWLIMGPPLSGSSFHIDPNATSAWNAVISGAKKWVLYPPHCIPPGVHPSEDGADVASPVSMSEWFMNFYGRPPRLREAEQQQQQRPGQGLVGRGSRGDVGGCCPEVVEGVCRAGEMMFVPHGWWHSVVNLEHSVAITQNYVSRSNILNVLEFLQRPNARLLVSGTTDRGSLHSRFKAKYEEEFPGSLEILQKAAFEKEKVNTQKLNFWEATCDKNSGAFKFGFC